MDNPKTQIDWRQIGNEWREFAAVVSKPSVAGFLIITILLLVGAALAPAIWISAGLSALAGLFASIAGARFERYWTSLHDVSSIQVRGQIAIRGLKELFRNTAALRSRITSHQLGLSNGNLSPEIMLALARRDWDEALIQTSLLEGQIVSAIENWTDIAPVFRSYIDAYQASELEAQKAKQELAIANKQLADLKTQQSSSANELWATRQLDLIRKLEDRLLLKESLRDRSAFPLGGSLGGTAQPDSYRSSSYSPSASPSPEWPKIDTLSFDSFPSPNENDKMDQK